MKYASTVPCNKGWGDLEYNWEGQCCCNCKHQVPLNQHPTNYTEIGKGRVGVYIGYACLAPELMPHATFFDHHRDKDGNLSEHHSMCECYEERDWKVTEDGHTVPADEKRLPSVETEEGC